MMEIVTSVGSMILAVALFGLGYYVGHMEAGAAGMSRGIEEEHVERSQAIRVTRKPRRSTADAETLVEPTRALPGLSDLVPYAVGEEK
jgi:hypothetical protein